MKTKITAGFCTACGDEAEQSSNGAWWHLRPPCKATLPQLKIRGQRFQEWAIKSKEA